MCCRQLPLLVVLLIFVVLSSAPARAVVWSERSIGEPADSEVATLPAISARAVLVVDITAGAELLSVDADDPLPPASTTKIITALTVRRFLALDEWVTIREQDLVDPAIYSHAGLLPGDRLTVHDLLAALLVASAGDAAQALARVTGERVSPASDSPLDAFVTAMNQEAVRLGLRHSHFLTPDGRDVPGQVTTARDLAIAAAHLLADPALASIVAATTWEITVEGPNARQLVLLNTNQLAGTPDVVGVKTGTSPAAGQCLVLGVRRGHDTVLVVVLGSVDRYGDVQAILDWMDARFRWITLDGASFPQLAALAERGIVPALAPTVLAPADQLDHLQLEIAEAPSAARVRGRVRLRFGTVDLVVSPLIDLRYQTEGRVRG
ncbi:serine hydrolase [Thermomicrobium sp. 4228-Ro]|uniref:D-alanyl-D-alanine carboxypeptidase family protein n=1 Tax=Thermomicrobium sp. 4228-Ro TaxID=2993937 RepID=UPI002249758C|nr:serine hydrolase [Thermomicrobium sp. 4228-Ro]MCX2726432.1 serine hydrolase [Thermomicrobium sp. 4228-Ro]